MNEHYLIALGSNRRHARYGSPRAALEAAAPYIEFGGAEMRAMSSIWRTRPVGPAQREFANAAAIISSDLTPHAMMAMLHGVERVFGRERRGQRWRERELDLDIILWSGGAIADFGLSIPHPRFRERDFVLGPAAEIARDWRDPITGLTVAQLNARLKRGPK
ncbi:MAG: 2-amino-4-hydroxy-6-hydroxymethyldihydropteridine diphosphokinase [Erythrobacter sp.]